ncbi:serine--tRNA ligase, partial [bacterium AH-315-P11]|nr:serine--tRNA ligase [bacterium AH-315-P11]
MLELRFIRENIDLVRKKTAHRGLATDIVDEFALVDQKRLKLLGKVEQLKNQRNIASKDIAKLKQGSTEEKNQADTLIPQLRKTSDTIKKLDKELGEIQNQLQDLVLSIPNLCNDDVPKGTDDADNVEIRKWGTKPEFSFTPKPHWEVGEDLG